MARELLRQIAALERLLRRDDALDADVLDEHVRRHRHQSPQRVTRTGIDQRNRRAVAVADQDRALYAELEQELGQTLQCLALHEVDTVRPLQHLRLAMAIARVDDRGQTGRVAYALGKIAPLADRAQTLVQEHQARAVGGCGDAPVFEAAAADADEGRWTGCWHGWFSGRPAGGRTDCRHPAFAAAGRGTCTPNFSSRKLTRKRE